MQHLIEAFEATFSDRVFTRSERQALKQLLADAQLDERKRGALRAQIFDFAREQFHSHDARQVLDWLENANKLLLDRPEPIASARSYFSPGDDCLDALLVQLQGAKQSLDICVFTITDNRISEKLIAVHRHGINVRIITDNDKADDHGSDIYQLSKAGIAVRIDNTPNHMHHKFAIVDGCTLLTGSYNWTRSAANVNHENLLFTNEMPVIRSFQREFEVLWKEMMPLG